MTRSLSIAFLSHLASRTAPTGAERSLALLAGGLRERGHRVDVVVPGPSSLEDSLARRRVVVHRVRCRPAWLMRTQDDSLPAFVYRWLRFAVPDPGRARLTRLLRRLSPDVVHVNCLPHVRGARAARAAGLPVVWHLREIPRPGPVRRWFARRVDTDADAVVAVSEAVAAWVRDEGLSKKTTVVPNGVPLPASIEDPAAARRALGIPEDGCLAGYFGQLLPHKGVLALVEAGRLALREEKTLRFVFAGSGPEEFVRGLRAELDRSESAGRFQLLPPRPNPEPLYAAADLVCLASTAPDPLPRTVMEAMASGRPVAAFRSGGVEEMVVDGKTGMLVETGDVQGLARSVVALARDPSLRRRMGSEGRRRAEELFSVELHLDRMEELLRRTASR
jgi:glycosyltransferase involved in cell wall biosynthesis